MLTMPVRREYEAELQRDNALDFDDLLLNGLRLLQENPRIVAKVQNVLIDEVRIFPSVIEPCRRKLTERQSVPRHQLDAILARQSHCSGEPVSDHCWRSGPVK